MKTQANRCGEFSIDMVGPSLSLEIPLPIFPNAPWKLLTRSAHLRATEMRMKYNSSAWSINGDVWNRDCYLNYIWASYVYAYRSDPIAC